ncbi:hypothetical protein BDV12DRAFT_20913 [Aspergillus spectabilis]
MVSSDDDCGDASPQLLSFSISIRSSRRRSRLAKPPTPPPACEESAHYPVFNPEDPRHNPTLRRSVCLEEIDSLPTTAHSTGSMRWMQGLPGRSLRRARSGLHALRSGLHRRPVQGTDGDHVINGLWPSSDSAEGSTDPNERLFSSTVSEASTEEDYDFGTDLYRTGCNYPDKKNKTSKDTGAPSSTPHPTPAPLPAPLPASSMEIHRPLVPPVQSAPTAPSDEAVPSPCTDPNTTIVDDIPAATLDDQWTVISAEVSESWAADEELHPTILELPSPNPSIPEAVASLDETGPESPSDDTQIPHVAAEETKMCCVSYSSSNASHQSRVGHIPCGLVEFIERREDNYSSGASSSKSTKARADEENIDLSPDTETALPDVRAEDSMQTNFSIDEQHIGDTAPTVELGNLRGMEYYLSLDTLAGNDTPESKISDEEPSPNSLDDDDRNAQLSPWLPTDKGERTSLLSLRDEYFFVDGKSTDLRPDRGDNPIKGERGFTGDGGLYSGPGLDRNVSIRTQEIPEIIGPGGPIGMPSPRPFRRDREGSDSTEEYLVTYSLFQRHYFS